MKAEEEKPWFDYLCGNHTRNLPIMNAFNREFEAYLKRVLGDDFAALAAECGTQTRGRQVACCSYGLCVS
jgi:hypothetical protein